MVTVGQHKGRCVEVSTSTICFMSFHFSVWICVNMLFGQDDQKRNISMQELIVLSMMQDISTLFWWRIVMYLGLKWPNRTKIYILVHVQPQLTYMHLIGWLVLAKNTVSLNGSIAMLPSERQIYKLSFLTLAIQPTYLYISY